MHIAVPPFVLGSSVHSITQCLQFVSAVLVNSHNVHNDAFLSLLFAVQHWNLPLFLSRADVMKSRCLQCQLEYWKKKSQDTRSWEHVPCLIV